MTTVNLAPWTPDSTDKHLAQLVQELLRAANLATHVRALPQTTDAAGTWLEVWRSSAIRTLSVVRIEVDALGLIADGTSGAALKLHAAFRRGTGNVTQVDSDYTADDSFEDNANQQIRSQIDTTNQQVYVQVRDDGANATTYHTWVKELRCEL